MSFKGSLTRDFWLQVFFMNQCPPGPQVHHWGRFAFFLKFAEIIANKCFSPVSTTPAISCSAVSCLYWCPCCCWPHWCCVLLASLLWLVLFLAFLRISPWYSCCLPILLLPVFLSCCWLPAFLLFLVALLLLASPTVANIPTVSGILELLSFLMLKASLRYSWHLSACCCWFSYIPRFTVLAVAGMSAVLHVAGITFSPIFSLYSRSDSCLCPYCY